MRWRTCWSGADGIGLCAARRLDRRRALTADRTAAPEQMLSALASITPRPSEVPLYSTVTAGLLEYGALGLPFRQALFVEATVISVNPARVGGRRLRAEGARHGPRQPDHRRGHRVVLLRRARHVLLPTRCRAVGDRVRVIPAHVDPTVAYHERMHVRRRGGTSSRRGRSTCGAGDDAPRVRLTARRPSSAARARNARPRCDSRCLASRPSSAKVGPPPPVRLEHRVVAEARRRPGRLGRCGRRRRPRPTSSRPSGQRTMATVRNRARRSVTPTSAAEELGHVVRVRGVLARRSGR